MDSADIISMIGNLSQSLPSIQAMLGGMSYILGIVFCMVALARFRDNFAKGGGGGDAQTTMWSPVAYLLAGAAMLFMPTMFDTLSNTLFGAGSSVLQYSGYNPYDIYTSMTILIETIGMVWFLRGCVLLAHSSKPSQGEEKGHGLKGFLFLIAGLFAINFQSTVNMLNFMLNNLMSLNAGAPS